MSSLSLLSGPTSLLAATAAASDLAKAASALIAVAAPSSKSAAATTTATATIITTVPPALTLRSPSFLQAWSLVVAGQAYTQTATGVLAAAVQKTAIVLTIVLAHLWAALTFAARHLFAASLVGAQFTGQQLWTSKTLIRLRKKLVFEVVAGLLGPGGNALVLLLLWPGWLVLGAVLVAARTYVG